MPENSFKNTLSRFGQFIKRIAIRVWEYLKVAKMEWIVMISLFALDLITKGIVEATVTTPVPIIPGFLQIARTHNDGSAYGTSFINDWLGPVGARIFFSVFAVAASVAFILVLIRNKGKSKLFRVAIAMFVAGAMGNCIDRMILGYVRDFIHFTFQPYVFNIADAELVFGVALLIIYFIFFFKDNDKRGENVTVPVIDDIDDKDPIAERAEVESAATEHTQQTVEKTEDAQKQDGGETADIAEPPSEPPESQAEADTAKAEEADE